MVILGFVVGFGFEARFERVNASSVQCQESYLRFCDAGRLDPSTLRRIMIHVSIPTPIYETWNQYSFMNYASKIRLFALDSISMLIYK